ncbi:hypothetical protein VNI00_016102 [Paramarasmius palmivorus]|uniref:Intradiol ring-cleavage dioxygenases domain-containing protein n=1 Tax=Paramarasmius palmivorus TaxID=297713 RepID=A0AAW0BGC6_9AGAR
MKFSALLSAVVLASVVSAHPEPHVHISRAELDRRQLAARERHLKARNCAADIAAFNARRKAKRSLAKRQEASTSASESSSTTASSTSSAAAPHYTTLQNTTCVLAPEVTEGPYYINNELVRQNLIEDQPGVTLVLDIGVLDVDTCTPLDDVFVEIWAANATGVYSGYSASSGGGGGGEGGSGGPPSSSMSAGASGAEASMTMSMPSDGGMGGGGMGGGSAAMARNETFLRGGYTTGSGGVVELTTIYPGFYTGRTAHIHTMIHMNYSTNANGTLSSHAGTLLHIGQMFFNESWNDQVYALSPYTENTQNTRTLNDADDILETENTDGNNAYLDLEMLGSTIEDGVLGYITIGVSAKASYSITNTNYLNSTGSSSSSDGSSSDSTSGNGDIKLLSTTGVFTSAVVLLSAFFCYNVLGH